MFFYLTTRNTKGVVSVFSSLTTLSSFNIYLPATLMPCPLTSTPLERGLPQKKCFHFSLLRDSWRPPTTSRQIARSGCPVKLSCHVLVVTFYVTQAIGRPSLNSPKTSSSITSTLPGIAHWCFARIEFPWGWHKLPLPRVPVHTRQCWWVAGSVPQAAVPLGAPLW